MNALSDNLLIFWCPEGDLNPHSPCGPADFKSAASADFAIRASAVGAAVIVSESVFGEREPENKKAVPERARPN